MHVLWLMRMHVVLAVTTVVVLLVVTVVVVVVVVVVVEVAAVAVGLDPSAVGAADHALVVVLAPAGGHAVVVLEEVARLVHQRRVAPARQHEPLTAPVVPAQHSLNFIYGRITVDDDGSDDEGHASIINLLQPVQSAMPIDGLVPRR